MAIEWTVEHSGHLPMSEFLIGLGDVLEQLLGVRPAVRVVRGTLAGEPVELTSDDAHRRTDDVAAADLDLRLELEIAGGPAEVSVSVYPPDVEDDGVAGVIIGADRTERSVAVGFAAACVLVSRTKGYFFGTGLGGDGVHQWSEVPDVLRAAAPGLATAEENVSALKATLWRGGLGG
jgi:hypothetical protein